MTMTREQCVAKLMDYYKENESDFTDDILSLNSYNGVLGDEEHYPMDEFDELMSNVAPSELAMRIFYGEDDDGDAFNPNRDYFYFNGYGNLVSTDDQDYSDYLDEDNVGEIVDYQNQLNLSDGAKEIIDEYLYSTDNEDEEDDE